MIQPTISDDLTMRGEQPLLANRYRVVKPLGQGGMGSVYLAEDTQLENFKVAIKMLPAVLVTNRRALKQLKAEALVSMKLVHSNIVPLRGFEENNGNPFLVMDYIEGQTLDDLLAEKEKLSEEETVRVLAPVAAALDYAHAKGVVHRDVKPGNVMIAKDGTPYVLDFGISREIQETMTRVTGKLSSGTLMYMSPEQLRGQSPKPAQDIYSFAAMAYECLKGEPPFVRGQIEFQILNEQPESPPGGTQLVASVMFGLAKKPEDRPRNCAAVLEGNISHRDMLSMVTGESLLSRPRATPMVKEDESLPLKHNKVQLWKGGPYWAETNIGAEKPWEPGYYFWWGGTVGYKYKDGIWVASDSSSSNFEFDPDKTPTEGKDLFTLQSEGWIMDDGTLASKHDAAQVHWGGGWRVPTGPELRDLCEKCDWIWTSTNGVDGYVVRGRGDYVSENIFLPVAGSGFGTSLSNAGSYGYYWSSIPDSDNYYSWSLYFYSSYHVSDGSPRYYGQSVRPVQGVTG